MAMTTPSSWFYMGLYAALWTPQTLLITAVRREDGSYPFEIGMVTFLIEICKLCLACLLYGSTVQFKLNAQTLRPIISYWRRGMLFFVPALVYAIYNILIFINLEYYDPPTYRVLNNIRIIWTGILTHFVLRRPQGTLRWLALVMLALGCMIASNGQIQTKFSLFYCITMLFQSFCSSFAGVYSELVLKKDTHVDINIQNAYLYACSICVNMIYLGIKQREIIFSSHSLQLFHGLGNVYVPFIIVLGAFAGWATSLLLKKLGAIFKEYATAIEMCCIAICSTLLFETPLSVMLILGMTMGFLSLYIYNHAANLDTELTWYQGLELLFQQQIRHIQQRGMWQRVPTTSNHEALWTIQGEDDDEDSGFSSLDEHDIPMQPLSHGLSSNLNV